MIRKLFLTVPALALVAGLAGAAEVKSGPQPGEKIPGPFNPLNINGEDAGEKRCLVCKNGTNPVIMVFARTADDPAVAKLIKKIDEVTAKNAGSEMGSFVVFCTDDDKAETKLKTLVDSNKIEKTILSIDNPQGPPKYKVSPDAEVTVVLYKEHMVKANHAFKKGEFKEADIEKVLADVTKIK
jgi:hypothetical protein